MASNHDDAERLRQEWIKCSLDPAYFIHTYCQIYNANERAWMPFRLWRPQLDVLDQMQRNRLLCILKARQLGLTWLGLGYMLWMMLFRPAATVAIFSARAEDAEEMLDLRLKGIYEELPPWLQVKQILRNNQSHWILSNGSRALAFPTTGGRGYTFGFVLVDEADYQPDLPKLMNAVKPTIDAGGSMALISTSDKQAPGSRFKMIYRNAKRGLNEWTPIFLPWWSRPERTQAWYDAERRDIFANTGSLDDLHQEYPATDTEALAPRTLDKRIPAPWLEACYAEIEPIDAPDAPALPGLEIYRRPDKDLQYVIGADPAEGNPSSDDSALVVMEIAGGEEVAQLSGKLQPSVLADYACRLARYYNNAAIMVERNNHGHAVLLWIEQNGGRLRRLPGHDGKIGWMSSALGKALLYNEMADTFRDEGTILHSFATYTQLASIEGSTLRAPDGEHDDCADAYALANAARHVEAAGGVTIQPGASSLYGSRERVGRRYRSQGRRRKANGRR